MTGNPGGGWWRNHADIDTTTSYNSLLADGGEMWFSMLYSRPAGSRFYFAITDDKAFNNGNLDNGATGIGFGLESTGELWASVWDDKNWGGSNLAGPSESSVDITGDGLVTNADGGSTVASTTYLIVGQVQWGATATDNDIVSLYLPATDLTLGSVVAQAEEVVDQSVFDRIATADGNGAATEWDEIRVGATYDDVAPIPEPSAALLGGLGLLALLRRRR